MTILHAFILGIVEGVTEFLPISSTAHLLFASKLLHISQNGFTTFFEVFIQSGAILAVLVLYYKKFLHHTSLIIHLLASFVPTAIVGLLLHKIIKTVFFQSTELVFLVFFTMGFVFIITEMMIKKKHLALNKSLTDVTIQHALLIGLFQALAVMPGISRAGAVLLAMMLLGYKREDAALYSFFLAVPTIFAASALDLVKTDFSIITQSNRALIIIVGFIVSFVSALFVIKWFMKFLQKNTLIPFGIYRILLTIILLFASVV